MPYIRTELQGEVRPCTERPASNVGELTYQFTALIQDYIVEHGLRYQQIAEILGALRGAALDFEDRVALPYERRKRAENGDVWEPLTRIDAI